MIIAQPPPQNHIHALRSFIQRIRRSRAVPRVRNFWTSICRPLQDGLKRDVPTDNRTGEPSKCNDFLIMSYSEG
jgi:hypothetical protein